MARGAVMMQPITPSPMLNQVHSRRSNGMRNFKRTILAAGLLSCVGLCGSAIFNIHSSLVPTSLEISAYSGAELRDVTQRELAQSAEHSSPIVAALSAHEGTLNARRIKKEPRRAGEILSLLHN